MPQPYFVPVMPSTSRNTHSSGVSSATSTSCFVPLMLIEKIMTFCSIATRNQRLLWYLSSGVGRVFDDLGHRIGVRDHHDMRRPRNDRGRARVGAFGHEGVQLRNN